MIGKIIAKLQLGRITKRIELENHKVPFSLRRKP